MVSKDNTNDTTAKDFFLYLTFAVTLIWLVTSFIMGSFELFNSWFPDVLGRDSWYVAGTSARLMGSLASLIIITPFFLLTANLINRDLLKNPEKKSMWVRRWLLYALLFIAFVVTVIDLAVLLNSFLQGELTARFVGKSLTVLAVFAAVFGYFFFDLRRDPLQSKRIPFFSGLVVGLAVVSISALGFSVTGSPADQRAIRLDSERIDDLNSIAWIIDNYVREGGGLPQTLSNLNFAADYLSDPETGEPYEYSLVDEDSFVLCATFMRMPAENMLPPSPSFQNISGPESWQHEVGESCFEFTVKEGAEQDHRSRVFVPEAVMPHR